jgi:hypothetical protein
LLNRNRIELPVVGPIGDVILFQGRVVLAILGGRRSRFLFLGGGGGGQAEEERDDDEEGERGRGHCSAWQRCLKKYQERRGFLHHSPQAYLIGYIGSGCKADRMAGRSFAGPTRTRI